MVIFRERHEGDSERFESALKKAKKGIKEACEIFEDMKDEFGERDGGDYRDRYNRRDDDYRRREEGRRRRDDDDDEFDERRRYSRR